MDGEEREKIQVHEDKIPNLPQAFVQRMESMLGEEYSAFMESFERGRYYGLRMNPLKDSADDFRCKMPFLLDEVSWAREGYYYRQEEQPGKHLLHELGAYYIQEPSAMAVAEILGPMPGERILDLCAAPGGKSTQIAGRMNGEGLLVSNEIVPGRAKILSQNVERMGIRNCVVCNEPPDKMAAFFPSFFDRIAVDAPCSGEGMFRKDDTAIEEWSPERVNMCAERQLAILEEAAKMLKPGGVLVYSTCTFAPAENEGVISRFLHSHETFRIEPVSHDASFTCGRPDWVEEPAEGIEDTMRLMPHRLKGEGHYIARLRKQGVLHTASSDENLVRSGEGKDGRKEKGRKQEIELTKRVDAFLSEEIGLKRGWLEEQGGALYRFGEQIYLVPESMIALKGLKIVRAGLHIGTDKKNRIEPSHALALALRPEETIRKREIAKAEAESYIRGESLSGGEEKGWVLLIYEGYPVGFGKAANGQIKNHYPKGLRKEL